MNASINTSALTDLSEITAAATRIAPYIINTPLIKNDWLSELAGTAVSIKWESQQLTGSFKLRGALNKMIRLQERGVKRVLAVSAGNHGLGVAYAAQLLGMHAIVVVPKTAAATKVAAIKHCGAELVACGENYDEAEAAARAQAARDEIEFVSPYNDADVIAGQGTVALEMLRAAKFDLLLVPVGGGGLLAGCARVARALATEDHQVIEVLGIQPANSTAMQSSFRAGKIVNVTETPTCADGLAGNIEADSITFPIIHQLVNDIVTVTEASIEAAIFRALKYDHMVLEGSGAVALAAILENKIERLIDRSNARIGIIASGRNIDIDRLTAIVARTRE